MTTYPRATYRPVQGIKNDPGIIPVGVILHVSGGESKSLHDYFDGPSNGIESHLHIAYDGTVEQYRDLDHEADANYRGNSWVGADGKRYGFLSVETQGTANGVWTGPQLDEIKRFLSWASKRYGFPLRKAPGYHSPGVGYHVMFGAGEGLDAWSNARGKVCPGPNRIRQFNDLLLPWMAEVSKPKPKPVAYYRGKPGSRTVRPGSRGDDVKMLKRWFGLSSKTGTYGLGLTVKVIAWKRMHKQAPSPTIGPWAWRKILGGK